MASVTIGGSIVNLDSEGILTTVAGADAANGAEAGTITVPAGHAYKLLMYSVALVTDANAANRWVSLVLDDGTTVLCRMQSKSQLTASLTVQMSWGVQLGNGASGAALVTGGAIDCGLPEDKRLLLKAASRIRTITTGIQATDNYGVPTATIIDYLVR